MEVYRIHAASGGVVSRLLKNPLLVRLLKKVRMQGGKRWAD
jgi:hypothetical protein